MNKLVLLLLVVILTQFASAQYLGERFIANSSSTTGISATDWRAQMFTIGTTGQNVIGNVTNVSFMYYKDNLGTLLVSIKAVNASGQPFGNDFYTGTFNTSSLAAGAPLTWVNVSMVGNGSLLQPSTQYGLVVRQMYGTGEFGVNSTGSYTGGNWSRNSSGFWLSQAGDAPFMIFNEGAGITGGVGTTLNLPADGAFVVSNPTVFNATGTPVSNTLSNATLSIWNMTQGLVNRTTMNMGAALNDSVFNVSLYEPGNYTWNVNICATNATGSYCAVANSNFSFTYGFLTASSYNPTTTATSTENFTLNITLATGITLSSAVFYYNGTAYSPSIVSNGNNLTLTNSITIPGNVTTSTVRNLYWSLTFAGVTTTYQYNTTNQQQTVGIIRIDNCTLNTNLMLNFTLRDEDSRAFINATNANWTTNYMVRLSGDLSGGEYVFYNNQSNTNPVRICVDGSLVAGTTYRLDVELNYEDNPNRVLETFYIDNLQTTNASFPLNYDLYDLLNTRSQEFTLTYADENGIPVSGAFIEIDRQYLDIGQFLPVEISKTGSDGQTTAHFVLGDVIYNLIVRKDGAVLATFTNLKAVCSNVATGQCSFTLRAPLSTTLLQDWRTYNNVSYTSSYNSSTRLYTFTFINVDGSPRSMNLTGVLFSADTTSNICSSTLSASSGTLSCTVPASAGNGTAIFSVYVDNILLLTDRQSLFGSLSAVLNPIRYLFAIAMLITLPLMGATSGVFMLIFFFIGLVAASVFGFIDTRGLIGISAVAMWAMIAGAILIWKVQRSEERG